MSACVLKRILARCSRIIQIEIIYEPKHHTDAPLHAFVLFRTNTHLKFTHTHTIFMFIHMNRQFSNAINFGYRICIILLNALCYHARFQCERAMAKPMRWSKAKVKLQATLFEQHTQIARICPYGDGERDTCGVWLCVRVQAERLVDCLLTSLHLTEHNVISYFINDSDAIIIFGKNTLG